jgi:hypothetical protein
MVLKRSWARRSRGQLPSAWLGASLLLMAGPLAAQDAPVNTPPPTYGAPAPEVPPTVEAPTPDVGTVNTAPPPEVGSPETPTPTTYAPNDLPQVPNPNPYPSTRAPDLRLNVDRRTGSQDDAFTFTVQSANSDVPELRDRSVLIERDGSPFRTLVADAKGQFRAQLPPARYTARAQARSARTSDSELLSSEREALTVLDFQLQVPASVPVGETFELRASLVGAQERGPLTFILTPVAGGPLLTRRAGRDWVVKLSLSAAGEYTVRARTQYGDVLTTKNYPLAARVPERPAPPAPEPPVDVKPEPVAPPVDQTPIEVTPTPAPSSWPWVLLAAGVAVLAVGGTVLIRRGRLGTRPPAPPHLTCSTRVSAQITLHSPPRIRFRLTARAVPDRGRQTILPPSTPAPKLEDAHGRRADHP